jgi:hypothetical protein
MSDPLILYSCATWLAYIINQRYYDGMHYVWCTPFFDPSSPFCIDAAVPPTSSPREIYNNLFEEVSRRDKHSAKIAQNRVGILRGADVKLKHGVITASQRDDIAAIVESAELLDFKPLLLAIPYAQAASQAVKVPIKDRAHPLSEEFIIENLSRSKFDVFELR